MAKDDKRPIIIKKRKVIGAGHHGGAWKVAYADFVTAMMAFFMVMWLVATVSKEERAAIFDYFKNPSMQPGKSAKPAPGQMGPGGASTSPIDMKGGLDSPKSILTTSPGAGAPMASQALQQDVVKEAAEIERKKLESLMADLREALSKSQALQPFKDQLLLDITPEGLRIQIVDEQNRPMFDLGSSRLKDYTVGILSELAKYLNTVPNRISLTGHTDIRPYPGRVYSNWELSADRANAARRALENGGLDTQKIALIVGLSSSVLFDKEHPEDPINRRISIVVLTKAAEDQALKADSAHPNDPPAVTEPAPLGNPIGVSTPSSRFTPAPAPQQKTITLDQSAAADLNAPPSDLVVAPVSTGGPVAAPGAATAPPKH